LYNLQLGNTTMGWALGSLNSSYTVYDLANTVYTRDFAAVATADVAAILVQNLGITGADLVAEATAVATSYLDAAAPDARGAVVIELTSLFAGLTTPAYAPFVAAFNAQIAAAVEYAQMPGSVDVPLDQPESMEGRVFMLTPVEAAGADVMRLTGDQDARIDLTVNDNQVRGLDLDGDGTIKNDGVENNNPTTLDDGQDFEIVDAYMRNRLNEYDIANNFLGDIEFDGTGFQGDGVATNGNIFLGGLGADTALGGIGNDFMVGGGVGGGNGGEDEMFGGRNADFFFAELSLLDNTDGNNLYIHGGNTTDDSAVGNNTPQDSDWLLIEVSDDEDGTLIDLGYYSDESLRVETGVGQWMWGDDIEHVDASGNLYGFLDDVDVAIGGGGSVVGGENVGIGSSAQLLIYGSLANNILIGGFDNDRIQGGNGNDLLMGGNLNYLNNPNLLEITDNGMDELFGDSGDDNIVFEADGGIVDGGSGEDTLWLTKDALGTQSATDLIDDGVLRIDLQADWLEDSAGYGGADAADGRVGGDGTQDQTNYRSSSSRVDVTSMESVIATGLGGVDYLAAGSNDPELVFNNQQNHFAYGGALDLRGNWYDNTLYASDGADILEGRGGDDSLSGGGGNDDFIFGTANGSGQNSGYGDGVDVIHRQTDADGDNIWDTDSDGNVLFERDFNIGGTSTTGASSLTVDLGTTDLSSPDVALTSFSIVIDGVTFAVTDGAALMAATSAAEVAALVNTAYQAIDPSVTATASGNVITVVDTDGRDISDTVQEGYAVGGVVSNGAFSAQATFNPAGTSVTQDRLIYKSYEDRADNEGVDDDSFIGSAIALGEDAYAEDLVIGFSDEDGDGMVTTRLAEDQYYEIYFENLTTEDKVTVTVNGVNYTLTVGVDLDGNIIAAEDGVNDNQFDIQNAFLQRLSTFINTYMDDDTSAGEVESWGGGNWLALWQLDYNGEETVYMHAPTVALTNASGGEPARYEVFNYADHEVELVDFDGRNGELHEDNVLFIGETGVSRAVLATAKDAGQTIVGSEALVIDVGPNNLQDTVFGTSTAIPNNTASNSPLSNVPNGVAFHGDDFLLGGKGLDSISGGTGDDRVEGSIGGNGTTTWDSLDGGKNFYAVQVLGEAQARVYVLNKWEAANPTKVAALQSLTISSINLINQSETGETTISGVFDDTLQFSQSLFTPGTTRFTVTLDNYTLAAGGVVELRNDGAGTVGVDTDGNGTIDNWTRFTNFENIRTVSGTGNAVAGSGQGNDTLNAVALSNTVTGAGGISYNLTNDGGAGEVRYSTDAIVTGTNLGTATGDKPQSGDYESLVLRVDGVENVLGGDGHDLLLIDESEAAKDNLFSAGLGVDRIVYSDDFGGAPAAGQPTMTIKVNAGADTDTVMLKGGRVGTLSTASGGATDTLVGVEYIGLAGEAAQSTREDDVIDVTMMASGAVVDYTNGEIRTGVAAGTGVQLVIENIVQMEKVVADGNDLVIVADAATMNDNARSDELNGTPAQNILFMTYLDFDQLNTGATTRKSFAAQVGANEITKVINQGQFTFSLSEVGTGADVDRVDYSNEGGRIVVPVGQGTATLPQYVVVDGDMDQTLSDTESRVDALLSVEQIVAAKGESVMDFSAVGAARQITFQYAVPSGNPTDKQVIEQIIRIADGTGNTLSGLNAFVEKYTYDSPTSLLPAVADATWNRIEGSDAAEVVIYQGSEDLVNQAGLDHRFTQDTLTLRGGSNEVSYSPLETSIRAVINVTDEDPATAGVAEGKISATVTFQDGLGINAPSGTFLGGQHTITSHSPDNATSAGSLKIEGSQDAEDVIEFAGLSPKTFILGTSPGVLNVNVGAATSMVLTGFEFVQDATTNDVYNFASLVASTGLNLIDTGPDHDTIKVGNDAAGPVFNGGIAGNTTISLDALDAFFAFDFEVLDVTGVTSNTVTTLMGGLFGKTDEVVVGALRNIANVDDFESVVVTQATVGENGTSFVLDSDANSLKAGGRTLAFNNDMNTVSFRGLVLEDALDEGQVANVTSGISFSVAGTSTESVAVFGGNGADTITGAAGDDVIRGGSGADTMDGGFVAEVTEKVVVTLPGGAAVLAAGETLTIAGVTLGDVGADILTAAGSDADQLGSAFAIWAAVPANRATLETNLGLAAGDLASVVFNTTSNNVIFSFTSQAGDVAAGTVTASVSAGTMVPAVFEDGTDASAQSVAYAARGESADRFVFEATGAANGADVINNFDATDVLDFSAYFDVSGGGGVGFWYNFGSFVGNFGSQSFVAIGYNKATLAASDFNVPGSNIQIGEGAAMVFLTTGDSDLVADATNDGWKAYHVYDSNPGAGVTVAVELVASVNTPEEFFLAPANVAT
jgi:hypothetical protein